MDRRTDTLTFPQLPQYKDAPTHTSMYTYPCMRPEAHTYTHTCSYTDTHQYTCSYSDINMSAPPHLSAHIWHPYLHTYSHAHLYIHLHYTCRYTPYTCPSDVKGDTQCTHLCVDMSTAMQSWKPLPLPAKHTEMCAHPLSFIPSQKNTQIHNSTCF